MDRRAFLAALRLLAGPLAVEAQPGHLRLIGLLSSWSWTELSSKRRAPMPRLSSCTRPASSTRKPESEQGGSRVILTQGGWQLRASCSRRGDYGRVDPPPGPRLAGTNP